MKTKQDQVREFMMVMGDTLPETPTMPSAEIRRLRCQLLLDEVLEYVHASGCCVFRSTDGKMTIGTSIGAEPDLAAMAHENADVIYVAEGSFCAMGVDGTAVFDEVQAANMRKLGPDGKPVRRADGKVLKPAGWTPADVASVLKRQGG